MESPKELCTADKRLWRKLFSNFNPRNQIEVEMSIRYLHWFKFYNAAKADCDKNGTVTEGRNGVPYPSPSYSNMAKAECEMRRLWKQLEGSMENKKKDTANLGEFETL